jgi:hypothetical protein
MLDCQKSTSYADFLSADLNVDTQTLISELIE